MATYKLLSLPGDGVGPEIITEALNVLNTVCEKYSLTVEVESANIGGVAIDAEGMPLPESTIKLGSCADVILMGAVGGPKWDNNLREQRPETGLLQLRQQYDLFANLRPAVLYSELADASSLKSELVADLDIMIVRELTGGIYFGKPRSLEKNKAFNTMIYNTTEIERITRVAIDIALKRNKKLCSVDKANVLEVSELWRNTVIKTAEKSKEIILSHMYVDNAAMQLVKEPKQFDVIVTGNLFGDILSDIAAMLTGSIGMLPSASLNSKNFGVFEPVHGSAPDIAGKNKANPLATILSLGMIFDYVFNLTEIASDIRDACKNVLKAGYRTLDIVDGRIDSSKVVGTSEMGELVCKALR